MTNHQLNMGTSQKNIVGFNLHYITQIDSDIYPGYSISLYTCDEEGDNLQDFHLGNYYCDAESALQAIISVKYSGIFSWNIWEGVTLLITDRQWTIKDVHCLDDEDCTPEIIEKLVKASGVDNGLIHQEA